MAKNYKMMSREQFLTKKSFAKEFVDLGNGEGVYVQEMNGSSLQIIADMQKDMANGERNLEAMAKIIALSVSDEEGNLIFELDDWKLIIENNSITTLTKLAEIATKVSKLNPQAVDEAKNNLKNG